MRRIFLAAAVLILADASAARAQFVAGPIAPFTGRGMLAPGGLYFGPGVRGGALLWGPGWRLRFLPLAGFPFIAPIPVVVGGPPVVVVPGSGLRLMIPAAGDTPSPPAIRGVPALPPPPLPPQAADDASPFGANPGDHIVIKPKKDQPLPPLPPPEPIPLPEKAAAVREKPAPIIVPAIPKVVAPPRPAPPPKGVAFDPFAPKKPVVMEKADPDLGKEVARLLKLGKESFEGAEYGEAGEQFQRAIAADPKKPLPIFLKAQAAFAAGRYANAVIAINAGLALDKTWPASAFDPKELYGANPGRFNEHVAALRAVIAANPGEASLEFLLGYELWFVGEKVEARKWFNLAERGTPGVSEAFK